MIKINEKFKKYGYEYNLMARTDRVAIYSMFKYGKVMAYEVHKIRQIKLCNAHTGLVELHERLASREQFGRYAWSYQHKEYAMAKYKEIGGI